MQASELRAQEAVRDLKDNGSEINTSHLLQAGQKQFWCCCCREVAQGFWEVERKVDVKPYSRVGQV